MKINLIIGVTDENNLEESKASFVCDENVEEVKKYLASDEEDLEIQLSSKYYAVNNLSDMMKYGFRFILTEGKMKNSSISDLYSMYLIDNNIANDSAVKAKYLLLLMNYYAVSEMPAGVSLTEIFRFFACSKNEPLFMEPGQWYFKFDLYDKDLEDALGDPSRDFFPIHDIKREYIEKFVLVKFIENYYNDWVMGKTENINDGKRDFLGYMVCRD